MNYGDRALELPPPEGGTPETDRSIRAITEVGLPPLRGPESDVNAATEIRLAKLIVADDLLTNLRVNEKETELGHQSADPAYRPVTASAVHAAQIALNHLRHQDDAAWWLAHRDRTADELIEMFTGVQQLPRPEG